MPRPPIPAPQLCTYLKVSIQPVYNEKEEIEQFMAMLREVDNRSGRTDAGTALCAA
jgi:hypothetical protein